MNLGPAAASLYSGGNIMSMSSELPEMDPVQPAGPEPNNANRRSPSLAADAAQRDLEAAQRLGSVGRLALGTAHDLKNALTCVLSFSSLASASESEAERATCRRELEVAANRAVGLLDQLLHLGKRSPKGRETLDVDARTTSLARAFQHLAPSEPRVVVRCTAESRSTILMDPVRYEQILLNLMANARDAMSERGGTLTVSTSVTDLAPGRAASLRIPSGRFVELIVRDCGTGISTTALRSIFEPFYSTKSPDQGTGLGLSIVRQVIDESHGAITVDTDQGRGTTFHVLLPATGEISEPAEPLEDLAEPNANPSNLLLIEPNPLTRGALEAALLKRGHTVTAVANLSIARQLDPSDFDVAVLDKRSDTHLLADAWRNCGHIPRWIVAEDEQGGCGSWTASRIENSLDARSMRHSC